jgi:hypothetical protein
MAWAGDVGRAGGHSRTVGPDEREVLYGVADVISKTGFAVLAWAHLSSPRRSTAAAGAGAAASGSVVVPP